MNAFVDYTYYTGTYKGSAIPSTDFDRMALEGSHFVNAITYGRADAIIQAETDQALLASVKMATCAAAEAHYEYMSQASGNPAIQNEKVGNYSVTYAAAGEVAQSLGMTALRKASIYLSDTNLLYRGID